MALSSSLNYTHTYDVFLSFRGVDTRTGFTGHLYSALCRGGILTFMDDDALGKGEEIASSLLNAIWKSRIAIVIFSKNYASSTFCLNELVQILECHNTKQNTWIWPVFYDVDPSEVRYQTGSYGQEFVKHEQDRFKDDKEKVQKWRLALSQAAALSGWHIKHGGEYEHVIITEIIEKISHMLNRPLLNIADYPVGLEARMRKVLSLMDTESDNKVKMLGIHGMGGVGKSTLARSIYNFIAHQFDSSCFLADVREKSSTRHGLVQIQATILSKLVGGRSIKLGDVHEGIQTLQKRLCQKKVLLVLDDVNKKEQLQATAGGLHWFGPDSMIIITTRDEQLLDGHSVEKKYKVDVLDADESLKLFRWNALKNKEVDQSWMEIIKRAIDYAGGLPLALETIGSDLSSKTLDEWESALGAYKEIPNRDIHEILRVSYDGLGEFEREIFLDIACFFKECSVRKVTNILNARGFHAENGISVLRKKSLINILRSTEYDDDIVTMHDLIQYMGKEIVREQSTLPEKPIRLWHYEDIICVLEKNMENDKIEAIMLDIPNDEEVQQNGQVFGKLNNLRMLIKKQGSFLSSPKQFPSSLKVLEWWGFPAAFLPSNVASKNLIILNLSYSCFQWDQPLQKSEVLSQLIFTGCMNIKEIPNVSGFPNLTELCVDDCINLIKIHDSVGFLDKLQRFSAKGCTKLRIIPCGIKLTSLEYLCLRDCSSLVIFPEILGLMEKLKFVDFEGTAIENLPLTLQNLKGLQKLHLNRCQMLENNALSNIINRLPNFFPFLKTLRLRDSNLTTIPECIKECHFLELLDLCYSKQLEEIRGLPPNIDDFLAYNCTSLETHSSGLNKLLNQAIDSTTRKFYVLPGERIPEWFDHSSEGNSVCFWFRKEFPAITVCAILGVGESMECPFFVNFNFFVKINDIEIPFLFDFNYNLDTDHMFMFNNFMYSMKMDHGGLVSENEWSYGEVLFVIPPYSGSSGKIKWTGVYVNRSFTTLEDVQFSTPYPSKTTQLDIPHTAFNPVVSMDTRMLSNEASLGTQDWHRPFMYAKWKLLMDELRSDSFMDIDSYNYSVPFSSLSKSAAVHVNRTLDSSSQSKTTHPGYRLWILQQEKSHRTQHWRNPVINPTWSKSKDRVLSTPFTEKNDNSRSNVKRKMISHPTSKGRTYMSKQVRDFAETQNVRAQKHFIPSVTERVDLYSRTSSNNMLSTKVEPSVRNQTEQPQDDDVEMETFYHSLGAKSHAFRSCDKSASTVLSKKAREALKIVQDFISDDALVLKHPERFSIMKNSLEYLFTLSADDGMSIAMESLISEALGKFTRWSRDYTEASMKIETTASELQRAGKLEAGLESNKNQFLEVLALENELQEKLAWMEKRKENLEEEIKDIKANISASETEKNMLRRRKRNVFEEGKALKTQRDELMEKAPRLQQEHGLAMETQTMIKAEWSELREKFKKVAAECDVPSEIRLLSRIKLLWLLSLLLLLLWVFCIEFFSERLDDKLLNGHN